MNINIKLSAAFQRDTIYEIINVLGVGVAVFLDYLKIGQEIFDELDSVTKKII